MREEQKYKNTHKEHNKMTTKKIGVLKRDTLKQSGH
jgi:hypothetical protein